MGKFLKREIKNIYFMRARDRHKTIVHKHIIAALVTLASIYGLVFMLIPAQPGIEASARIMLGAKLLGFLALPLLFGIATTVHARYCDASLINGYKATSTERISFLLAYNSNTLEQTVLHTLALLAFCAAAPESLLPISIAQVAAFLLGRAMFFIGYRKDPMYRLAGFAVGYYPAIAAILSACFFTVTGVS